VSPKVLPKQLKRGHRWHTDGSCIRRRPERPNHVWSHDFAGDCTQEGRKFRMLNVLDAFTPKCLSMHINRKLGAFDVIDVLSVPFTLRGISGHIGFD
jgi:putative transposase